MKLPDNATIGFLMKTLALSTSQALSLFAILILGGWISSDPSKGLMEELKHRSKDEGLGLVCLQGNSLQVVDFSEGPRSIRNPRDMSSAVISGTGDFIVWKILNSSYKPRAACASPILVQAANGTQALQLPGETANVYPMAVSRTGRVVLSSASAVLRPASAPGRSGSGFQLADFETKAVGQFPGFPAQPMVVGSVSWSADDNLIAYSAEGHVYTYNIISKTERVIGSGSNPSWSPNGKWIAFKSIAGEATIIEPNTLETKAILPGRKIEWGVHWSPDSRYVMVAVKTGQAAGILHGGLLEDRTRKMLIQRVDDGASVQGEWFAIQGTDDRDYFWVKDHRAFLRTASTPPVLQPCGAASGDSR